MTTHRRFAVLLAASLLLAGCGGGGSADGSSADAPATLKVATLPTISFAPLYIAEGKGYFADEDLDVEFVATARGVESLPLLLQGDLDVWAGSMNPAMFTAAQAGRLRVVADKGSLPASQCGYSGILANPSVVDADGNVRAEALRAPRVGTSGSLINEYVIATWIESQGGASEDVVLEIMGQGDRIAALAVGQIDFAQVAEPSYTRAVDEGMIDIARSNTIVPDLPLAVIGYGQRLLDDRELGLRFMRAYLRGVADYQAGPTDENVQLVSEATDDDPELLERVCWPAIASNGLIDPTPVIGAMQYGVDHELLADIVPADQWFDPTFAEEAFADLTPG